MKSKSLVLVFCMLMFMSFALAIPQTFNIHGKLTDNAGAPQTDSVSMTFKIYNVYTGGTDLWSEVQTIDPDDNGVYSAILNDIDLPFNASYYLGIKVGSDAEMTPRLNLTSAPYAFRAQNVSVGGVEFDGLVNLTGQNLWTTGNITAGYFLGSGKYLTDIETGSLNISEVNYWTKTNDNLTYTGGRVGIGTSDPLATLDIQGIDGTDVGVSLFSDSASGDRPVIRIYGYADSRSSQDYADMYIDTWGRLRVSNTGFYPEEIISDEYFINSNQRNSITSGTDSSLFLGLGYYDTAQNGRNLIVGARGNEGQINPTYTLDPTLYIASSDTSTANSKYLKFYNNQTSGFIETSTEDLNLNPASGNVNVSGTLTIANGTADSHAVTLAQLEAVQAGASGDYVPYTGASGDVNLNDKNLTNVNRLGIGVTDPSYELEVDGYIKFRNGIMGGRGTNDFGSTGFVYDGGVSTSYQLMALGNDNGELFTVLGNGNVGIGDASPDGSLKLDVAGQVGATEYCDESGSNCIDSEELDNFVLGDQQSYTSVDSDPGVDAWYTVMSINDAFNVPVIMNVRAYAHTSGSFLISEGYSTGGQMITVLQSNVASRNGAYKYLEGIRITDEGKIQLKLNEGSIVDIDVWEPHD